MKIELLIVPSEEKKKICEALEKQIPKKPIYYRHCPSCEAGLPVPEMTDESCSCCYYPKYCMICGQAINWSEAK